MESFGLISILIFSLTPTPCASAVFKRATLSVILKIGKSLLNGVKENILAPVVLIRSELLKNKSSDIVNTPVNTFTFTVFCAVVPSKTCPVATGAFTPSDSDKIAPLV